MDEVGGFTNLFMQIGIDLYQVLAFVQSSQFPSQNPYLNSTYVPGILTLGPNKDASIASIIFFFVRVDLCTLSSLGNCLA